MTATDVLSQKGVEALARYVAPGTLFAFDLDGTLAPIVEDYSAVTIAEPVRNILKRLTNLATVAVITGRSRQDAMAILALKPQLLVGNHGAEWPEQEENLNCRHTTICQKWHECLYDMLHQEQGVEIEFKGESVTLHYRKADDAENALSRIYAAIEKLDPAPRIIGGKFVVNVLPMEAFTKGAALVAAMEMFGLKRAIFFGDDVTDEEVFRLQNVDVFGIHIGKDNQTAAPYYLKKQSELAGLLDSMVRILESHF
ncbi:MAG: trehalose-phosphatase [Pelobacteraceae bacterium]